MNKQTNKKRHHGSSDKQQAANQKVATFCNIFPDVFGVGVTIPLQHIRTSIATACGTLFPLFFCCCQHYNALCAPNVDVKTILKRHNSSELYTFSELFDVVVVATLLLLLLLLDPFDVCDCFFCSLLVRALRRLTCRWCFSTL